MGPFFPETVEIPHSQSLFIIAAFDFFFRFLFYIYFSMLGETIRYSTNYSSKLNLKLLYDMI